MLRQNGLRETRRAMTLDEFRHTLASQEPPADLTSALIALWHDGRGDWTRAHETAQDIDTPAGAWVHAYLHRKEGDAGNAGYWYRRAGRPIASGSLDSEWNEIVTALLAGDASPADARAGKESR
jgi:hypothetical protein